MGSEYCAISPMSVIISARPDPLFAYSLTKIISWRNFKSVSPRRLPLFVLGFNINTVMFSNSMELSPLSTISLKMADDLFKVRSGTTALVPVLYSHSSMHQQQLSIMESNHHLTNPPYLYFFFFWTGLSTFFVFVSMGLFANFESLGGRPNLYIP